MDSEKLKNIKIGKTSHDLLKEYCDDRGLKIYKFLEKLIKENCKPKKDLYGDN